MVAYGYLTLNSTNLSFAGFLSNVRNPTAPLALQKVYLGAATDEGVEIWRIGLPTTSSLS